jgi:hypothetical protein
MDFKEIDFEIVGWIDAQNGVKVWAVVNLQFL